MAILTNIGKLLKLARSNQGGFEVARIMLTSFLVLSAMASIQDLSSSALVKKADAAEFLFRTNQGAFSAGDTMVVYGKGAANDTLVARLVDPAGKVLRQDILKLDKNGIFTAQLFTWPPASNTYPYGIYNLEVISSIGSPNTQEIPIVFTQNAAVSQIPQQHTLAAKLDSPTQVSTNSTFRVFVQVTFDGALVNSNGTDLLGSSHIHYGSGGNQTINLGKSFVQLHEGLYYADVKLPQQGTYIIHAIAFYKGYLAHDSKVITVSNSSIGSIQQSVDQLNTKLNATNKQLVNLQNQLTTTNVVLNKTGETLSNSVNQAKSSIDTDINSLRDASGQLNSIILPILALISVIIALQISLFARIRASYK